MSGTLYAFGCFWGLRQGCQYYGGRQFRVHSSQRTAHSSQLTAHSSQLTAYSKQLSEIAENLLSEAKSAPPSRDTALTLLTADALITYACEALAEGDPERLAGLI